ncbi:MAG: hypothetical protein AAF682_30710 [Planctomycetota bacterium]
MRLRLLLTPLRNAPITAWLWVGLPLGAVAAQIAAKAVGEDFYRRTMRSELGLVENATVLLLLVALVTALRLFAARRRVASAGLFGAFALVMALGCFFFAGEEASWGQHWAGFEPPADIAARNEQGELNFHNDPVLETFLDQLPRNLLTAAALLGGILVPLRRLRRGAPECPRFDRPGLRAWIWPTVVCLPAAVVAVGVTLPKKAFRALDRQVPYLIDISPGETKELALAAFLMLYLLVLHRELAEVKAS